MPQADKDDLDPLDNPFERQPRKNLQMIEEVDEPLPSVMDRRRARQCPNAPVEEEKGEGVDSGGKK